MALRPAQGRPGAPNEGARLLAAAPGSQRSKAAALGVSNESVRRWLAGDKVPFDQRPALERVFRIPQTAWDRAPGKASAPKPKKPPSESAPQPDVERMLLAAVDDPANAIGARVRAAAELRAWRAQEEQQRTNVQRAIASAEWQGTLDLLCDVLRAHPMACVEVLVFCLRAEGDNAKAELLEAELSAWAKKHRAAVAKFKAANAAIAKVADWTKGARPGTLLARVA